MQNENEHKIIREDLIRMIDEIEMNIPVDQWKYEDIDIWPVIRNHLAFKTILSHQIREDGRLNRTTNRNQGKIVRIKRRISDFHRQLNMIRAVKNKSVLFTGNYNLLTEFQGRLHHRLIDPLVDSNKAIQIFYKADEYISYHKLRSRGYNITPIIENLRFVNNLTKRKYSSIPHHFPGIDTLQNIVKKHFDHKTDDLLSEITKQIHLVSEIRDAWLKLLTNSEIKTVYLICYYQIQNMALISACKDLDIKCIEIQHGIMHKHHPGYKPYLKNPPDGYNTVPRNFYLWDNRSRKQFSIYKSANPFLTVKVIGNPWTEYILKNQSRKYPVHKQHEEKTTILVALQPIDNPIPDFIRELIHEMSEHSWKIRFHPRQQLVSQNISVKDDPFNLPNVEHRKSSTIPLPELLQNTTILITAFSSCLLEAHSFGVPCIYFDKRGKLYFEDMENNETSSPVIFASSKEEMRLSIKTILTNKNHEPTS